VLEQIGVRCPTSADVVQVGATSGHAAPAGVTITPLDPGNMTVGSASQWNVVWPTSVIGGVSALPLTAVGLPVGSWFTFWVGNGAGSTPISCTGTAIVRYLQ
jgi:hypothetical protein